MKETRPAVFHAACRAACHAACHGHPGHVPCTGRMPVAVRLRAHLVGGVKVLSKST